ncbi:MAG: hypothetical protein HY744_08970 [Deltaproteobacteria bacterium]|nr:hypothetical protein [Deltaproteobacteria bacterium]
MLGCRAARRRDELRKEVNVANLDSAAIEPGVYSCIDAVPMAVKLAKQVRFSNSTVSRWARWDLDAERTEQTWWNHAAGQSAIDAAADHQVTVLAYNNGTSSCWQNKYGIMAIDVHGGSFPAATLNPQGNTTGGDWCLAIGVQTGGSVHGFSQNGNGFDAPSA